MKNLDRGRVLEERPHAPAHLGLCRALARLTIFLERACPALWPAAGVGCFFLVIVLFGTLTWLPGWLHVLVVIGFATLFTYQLVRGVLRIRPPTAFDATRRLETDSGLEHRPLMAITDKPAIGVVDSETEQLWNLHLAQAAAAARGLRLSWPHPNMADQDPFALRIALGVLLAVGLVTAGPTAPDRIRTAFTPSLQGLADTQAASLELWITPPGYTNMPARLLASADPKAAAQIKAGIGHKIPVGSTLLAHVSQARQAPDLKIGETNVTPKLISGDSWRIEAPLNEVGPQSVGINISGREIGVWDINVISDSAPEIRFVELPQSTPSKTLQISYKGKDDHGIVGVVAEITWPLASQNAALAPGPFELPLPHPDPRAGSAISIHDLTKHPWAGLEVDIRLIATDGRGQNGHTNRLAVLLPERSFNHPVARDIIEQRRVLALSPDSRKEVAHALHNIGSLPERFDSDVVVFLALISAGSRLVHMPANDTLTPILSQLWDTALRLEDGALSLTQNELMRLQGELRRALKNGASEEVVGELMKELRAKLDQYLEALAQNLAQASEGMDLSSLPAAHEDANHVDRNAIKETLDQIEQMARLGNMEGVEQLLERMQQILKALRDAPDQLHRPSNLLAQEVLRKLHDIVRRQQDLQDDVFQRKQSGERMSEEEAQRLRKTQKDIRGQLRNMMRQLGEMIDQVPENLSNAENAMKEAETALQGEDLLRALRDQARALAELQQGAQSMALQLLRRPGSGQALGQRQGDIAQPGQEGFDPLGRQLGDQSENPEGFAPNSRGGIGDGEQARRALEIIDELRERVRDRSRPTLERDYLERLLRRF